MQNKINVKRIRSKSFAESESYKKLRTNIQFSGKDIKTIAFTSTFPGEGKSEIAYRVAFSMAEMGKKTIYLDSDLRNSTFLTHKTEAFKGELKGLVHCLVGENTLSEIIVGTQNPNLDFIPIGAIPPNPSELLSQDTYAEIIAELKTRYDYIIIDAAPAGYVVDGVIASKAADGVIFVVASGTTAAKAAKTAVMELSQSGCKLIGCVLNKCQAEDETRYGYNSYGYGYGSGYTKGFSEDKKKSNFVTRIMDKIKKK